MTGDKSIVFKFADVEVREREFCLVKAGEVLPVEPKTFRVLLYLLRNPQKLIAKEELLNAVWGDAVVTDSSLTRTIAQLRRLLGDEIRNPRYIETVATVGYRFLYKVEISEDASGGPGTTDQANGLSEADIVETPAIGQIAKAAANPPAQIDTAVMDKGQNGKQTDRRRNRPWKWLLPGAALLAVGVAVAVWYLRRPLPPLQVTEYTRITHDGQREASGRNRRQQALFHSGFTARSSPLHRLQYPAERSCQFQSALQVFSLQDVSPDGSSLLVASFDGGHWELVERSDSGRLVSANC